MLGFPFVVACVDLILARVTKHSTKQCHTIEPDTEIGRNRLLPLSTVVLRVSSLTSHIYNQRLPSIYFIKLFPALA